MLSGREWFPLGGRDGPDPLRLVLGQLSGLTHGEEALVQVVARPATMREQHRLLAAARRLFFGAGGHDCLIVAPDVRPGLAAQVLQSLRTVDPELPTATFGPVVRRADSPTRTAMLAGFHPSSRAGAGALLRFLGALRLR